MSETPDEPRDEARDEWMRRTGPFFPLLVAATGQTRLPIASDLSPTPSDIGRAQAWGPLVGGLLGLSLGFLAAVLSRIGIADVATAALIASGWLFLTGGWAEVQVAKRLERLLSRGASEGAGGESGPALSFTITLVVSILLRVTLLVSIATTSWTAALVASAACARFAPVAASWGKKLSAIIARAQAPPPWPIVASLAFVAIGIPLFLGWPGVGSVAVTLIAVGIALITRSASPQPVLILATELAVLVCFAGASTYPLFWG